MYSPNQPRASNGEWSPNGGVDPRAVTKAHDNVKSVGTHPPDGTYDAFGVTPKTGFMVGGATHSRYTGAWTDPKTGKFYPDKSTRVRDAVLAKSLGRQRNQISVYDLTNRRTIATGGNGRVH